MKQFFGLTLLLFLLVQAVAAQVVITGQITAPKGDLVTVSLEGKAYPGIERESYTAKVDAEGKFKLEVPVKQASPARFGHGDETTAIYLQPGKDFFLSLDTSQFDESLQYSGAGADVNNYLAAYYLFDEGLTADMTTKIKELDPKAFTAHSTEIRDKRLAFLEEKGKNLPKAFAQELREGIRYGRSYDLMQYPYLKAYFNNKQGHEPVEESYYAFEKELPLNNEAALGSPVYRNYLYQTVAREYTDSLEQAGATVDNNYLLGVYEYAEKKLQGEPRAYLQAHILQDAIDHVGLKQVQPLLASYKSRSDTRAYHAGLDKLVAKAEKLAAGEPAPDFKLTSLEGKEVSLSDFKGKVVYLDFWASWCGPCIGEVPASKELKAYFKDREDVVFLYVSIDDNPDAWKKMIEKQQIQGVHLLSQGWNSTAAQAYNIRGIPRYVLIDREGRLVDANTSRPSAPETRKKIEEALALN